MTDIIDGRILRKYQIVKKIGKGAYGQVWKVYDKQTKNVCALKKIFDAFRNTTDCQRTYRQIMFLKELKHTCIVQLINFYQSSNEKDMYVCFQFIQSDLAITLKNKFLKDIHKQYIFTQIAHAIFYIHSGDLIHRDIKPSNILVNVNCDAKLCDFGLVRSLSNKNQQKLVLTQNIATRWYKAPQLLLSSNCYGKGVDIWSLGCILAQMFLGQPIFQGNSAFHQLQSIIELTGKPQKDLKHIIQSQTSLAILQSLQVKKSKKIKDILPYIDPLIQDLLQKIFKFDPVDRPTIEQIICHPYLLRFRDKIKLKKLSQPIKIKYDKNTLTVDQYKTLLSGKTCTIAKKQNPEILPQKLPILKAVKSKINLQSSKNISEKQKTPKKQNQNNDKSKVLNNKSKSPQPNSPKTVKSTKNFNSPKSFQQELSMSKTQKVSLIDKKSPQKILNKNLSPTKISNLRSPKAKNIQLFQKPTTTLVKNNSQIKLITFSPKSKIVDDKSFKFTQNKQVNQVPTTPKNSKVSINNSASSTQYSDYKIMKYDKTINNISPHNSPTSCLNSSLTRKGQTKILVKKYDYKPEVKVKNNYEPSFLKK